MATTESISLITRYQSFNRLQKTLFWSTVALLLYTITGFLILPPVSRMVLEKKLPQILERSVVISKIRLNPFTLTATVEGFDISRQDGRAPFAAFERLFVNLQVASLFKQALIVKSVHLTGLQSTASRDAEGVFNFADLLPAEEEAAQPKEESAPFLFAIHNIELVNGDLVFEDGPKEMTHRLANLNLAIPSFSNLPYDIDTFVQPAFSALINGKEFSMAGKAKPFTDSRETSIDLSLKDLDIPEYLAYIPNPTDLRLKSALVDLETTLAFKQSSQGGGELSLAGTVTVRSVEVTDRQGKSFIRLPQVVVQLAPANLLASQVHITELAILGPELLVERLDDNRLLPLALAMPEEPEAGEMQGSDEEGDSQTPLVLTIDRIVLDKGDLNFSDLAAQSFASRLHPIDLQLENFSTAPQAEPAAFNLSLASEAHEKIALKGAFDLDPMQVIGTLALEAFTLNKYMPYIRDFLAAEVSSGQLDFSTSFSFTPDPETPAASLSGLSLTLSDLSIDPQGEGEGRFLSLGSLQVSQGEVDLQKRTVRLAGVSSQDLTVHAVRDKDGTIDLLTLPIIAEETRPAATAEQKGEPFLVEVASLELINHDLAFSDHQPADPAELRVDDLNLTLKNLSTAKESRADLEYSMTLNRQGSLSGRGKLGVTPLNAAMKMELVDMALTPLNPYLAEQVNLLITKGGVSVEGDLDFAMPEEGDLSLDFTGSSRVKDLETADTAQGEELVAWQLLTLDEIDFSLAANTLAVKEIGLQELHGKVIVQEDGAVNLASLKKTPPQETEVTPPPEEEGAEAEGEAMTIVIDNVTLEGGGLDIIDRKVQPAFSGSLSELSGAVTGLSSMEESRAQVRLAGKFNQQAPLEVKGAINPLKDELFADLKIDFHDMDLSPTSPYTGKFIGYKIDKGKLTLDLNYLIEGSKVKASNHAFLDQFTLGETVESPDAVSLPLHLAIALLKNRKGEIELDVPVQGDLDDPEFSVGGVVVRVIFNLIAKAVTSPFALLGALIPDGEDLQSVDFAAGGAEIDEGAAANLEQMAKVLFERPGLRIDIQGKTDPVADQRALQEKGLQRLVAAGKLKEQSVGKKEAVLPDLAAVVVSPEEYPYYLSLAYESVFPPQAEEVATAAETAKASVEEEKAAESKDKTVAQEGPSVAEMEERLIETIEIGEAELRLLAISRAQNALDFLAASGPVEVERMFVLEPRQAGEDDEAGASVEMVIK